ncbi:hypothetical protein NQ314_014544 [Rhamnusium bicolor]|uniref:Uncharacterized protein n=1 Tax=Rhamnusium bicolor TaxID=1586634 RepID=A0AAV8X1D8_9CUCU|nr:hypothetical protein NQ314_014544 [Rhamnusium bicolor]
METKLCRICGKLGQNFIHIFKTEGLRNKIETCLPIIVSPHCLLPDTMCGECTENVDNFYIFIKNCLQNIIILETQYDIQESCLKSKRKKDKGCYVDFTHKRDNKGVQTDDYLDVLIGKKSDLEEYSLNFPLMAKFLDTAEEIKVKPPACLVEYDIDSDSNLEDNDNSSGKVILGQKLESLNKVNNLVESMISGKNSFTVKNKCYFDDAENNLITEISQRKNLKQERINSRKKLDTQVAEVSDEPSFNFGNFESIYQNENANNCSGNGVDKDLPNSTTENQQSIITQSEKLLSSLPQSCLLCDTHFLGPAALATHVFETHGIDMAEVVSSGSGESFPEKKSDSIDDNQLPDQQPEDPPTLSPSFVCPSCPAVFSTKPDLMMHLRLKHTQQAAYLCGLCLQQCNTYMNLKSHLQVCSQQHQIGTRYICQVCQYGDDNFKWLENHVLVHDFLLEACKKQSKMFDPADYIDTNENFENGPLSPGSKKFNTHRRSQHSIFHCDLCNKFYGRNSHLWKHVNRLHKGHPSITCQLCYKTSASKYHLAQHFNKIHLTKTPKHKTLDSLPTVKEDFMAQKFQAFDFQSVKQSFMRQEIIDQERKTSISEVEDNSNNHLSDQEEEPVPEKSIKLEPITIKEEIVAAPKEIDSSHNLYTNIITNYTPPVNEGEFKCPKCSKAFHKKVLLKKHKKNCRPKLQKDLLTRCKTCARIFKDRQSLAKHLVNYHSEYVCEICNEKVQSKCEIVSHIRFQHPGCHLFCKVCSNILRSQDDLQEHLRDHLESYVCQFCGDSLPSKIKLKMHILSLHRKILSLSCGICLKLFETQHILRDHVTLIHKDQLTPLTSCPVCGKNYGSKWKTYDHLNKSHGRIFKACKTCLEVFDNDAQLQAHCDVTTHGGQGGNVNANAIRNSIMAHITSAINNVATNNDVININNEDESDSGEENDDNSDQSNDEYENDIEEPKFYLQPQPPPLLHESRISLLEKRLLGKRIRPNINEVKLKSASEIKKEKSPTEISTTANIKKEDDVEPTNSPSNPQMHSSKRTVYVNSNDPSYCEICFKTWPAKKHLWQHYIRCHKSVAATVCGICLKTNDSYASLQVHLRENHPTLLHGQGFGSNFICRICGRYHNASSKLRLHMVIHENFNWSLIDEIETAKPIKQENEKKTETNGYKEQHDDSLEVYDENDINYESLIEQVECSSQSENEDSDNEQSQIEVKQEQSSSSEEEEVEESEESVLSENSMQAQMLTNMIKEKQNLAESNDNQESYVSSSEDSSSSLTDENNGEIESESSEEDCSQDSRSLSSQSKFLVRSNSNSVDSVLNSNIFSRKPDELDSAIKSISYECIEPVDLKIEDDYCELNTNCLNENEIESAVGSIL